MNEQLSDKDRANLAFLDKKPEAKKTPTNPEKERIIAGFEEIQRFAAAHHSPPKNGNDKDIFERIYAVRLNRLKKALPDSPQMLKPLDHQGLLTESGGHALEEDDSLAAPSVEAETDDISNLRHVRSAAQKMTPAEDIAKRKKCKDFHLFKPLFEQVHKELHAGLRTTQPFQKRDEIKPGGLFILGGQLAYVAKEGQAFFVGKQGKDARLRVIFGNGTESNLLMRSLQRALNKDTTGRSITDPNSGPLFADKTEDGDEPSGTIYVLRSNSKLPEVQENRTLLHKIGVTNEKVERRIANAKNDPTFLLAEVEIVATYELFNINRTKLENLIHRIFDSARLDIEIMDRFGNPVTPREWFLVPVSAIDEAVQRIKNETIAEYRYNPKNASFETMEEKKK